MVRHSLQRTVLWAISGQTVRCTNDINMALAAIARSTSRLSGSVHGTRSQGVGTMLRAHGAVETARATE